MAHSAHTTIDEQVRRGRRSIDGRHRLLGIPGKGPRRAAATGGRTVAIAPERHLPSEWWRTLFNSLYLETDGDIVENDRNTEQEVDLLVRSAGLQRIDRILDLCCGQGRHSLELPRLLTYESKWLPDSPYWSQIAYREACLDEDTRRKLTDYANILFERLGCRDYARFDFRADATGEIKLLEVNPNPGWCWDGKLNLMAEMAGLRYPDLLRLILEAAQERVAAHRPGLVIPIAENRAVGD